MLRVFLLFTALGLFLSCSDDATNEPQTITISGVIQKAGSGQVLPGADVIAFRHDDGAELGRTKTDTSGVFVLRGLPQVLIDLQVEATGYATLLFPSMDPARQPESFRNLSFMMETADSCCDGILRLTVKNAAGEKLKNIPVVVKQGGTAIADPRTDEDGKIVVDGLCPGEYSIRIATDLYKVYEAVFAINGECDPVELTATLEPKSEGCCDGVLTVTAKDQDGNAVMGALVKLWKGGAILQKTFTDSSGVAVFSNLCRGEYGVDVSKDGLTNREFGFAINENCDPVSKTVVMERLGCCSGVFTLIVRDKDNNPVEGAKVLIRKGMTVIEDPRTDANGRIVVDGLCKGEYNFRVSKEGWKVLEGVFAINENCDPVTREVTMEQQAEKCCTGVLTVIVRDPQNNPIENAQVRVWKSGNILKTATTNANGIAVVGELCGGEYGVDVMKEGWTDREFVFAINENCDPVTKEVTMEQLGCCSGVFTLIVRDGQNNPVIGAKVQVRRGSKEIEAPTTNQDGRIVVDGLCKGEYSFRVSKEGWKVLEGVFAINENCDPVTKEVTLQTSSACCSGVLTVTVVDSTNTPIENATVKLWKNGAVLEKLQTDSSGKAVFDGLCAGNYGVDVEKSPFKGREFTFSINENCDPYQKTVELLP